MTVNANALKCIFSISNEIQNLDKEKIAHRAKRKIEDYIEDSLSNQIEKHHIVNTKKPRLVLPRYVDALTPDTPGILDRNLDRNRMWYSVLAEMVETQERLFNYFLTSGRKSNETECMKEYIKRTMLQVLFDDFHTRKKQGVDYHLEAKYRQFIYLLMGTIITGIAARVSTDKEIKKQVSVETKHLRSTPIDSIKLLEFIKRLVITKPEFPPDNGNRTTVCSLCSGVATDRAKTVVDLNLYKPKNSGIVGNNEIISVRYVFCQSQKHRDIADSLILILLYEQRMRYSIVPNAIDQLRANGETDITSGKVFEHIANDQVNDIRRAINCIKQNLSAYFRFVLKENVAMGLMGKFIPCEISTDDERFNPNELDVSFQEMIDI